MSDRFDRWWVTGVDIRIRKNTALGQGISHTGVKRGLETIYSLYMLHNCRSYFDRKQQSTGGRDVMNKWMRWSVCFYMRGTFFDWLMLNCQVLRRGCLKIPSRHVLRHLKNTLVWITISVWYDFQTKKLKNWLGLGFFLSAHLLLLCR